MKKRSIFTLILGFIFLFVMCGVYYGGHTFWGQKGYAASGTSSEIQLLARCVNGEARGEPYEGQVAVAAVILNRVKHPSFPNTIAGVIYQPRAFTATVDGQIHVPIAENSTIYRACRDAMNGWDPSNGAVYYYNPRKATSRWIFSREVVRVIGNHRFAK
ncbi:MAG: spore cortex-lytic enzyme SleB [Ruminococcaceae bacterium]|nr:spore cortex-lytic enzyme SleB [Oscillospiraceae bacterium]